MTTKIDIVKSASHITTLITLIIALGTTIFAVNKYFQKRDDSLVQGLEIRAEILDRDIKKDAEIRHYYKSKSLIGELDKAEKNRLEYLDEQLDQKYDEQRANFQRLRDLKQGK